MKPHNSIIVPAYNEEKRSSNFISDLIGFVHKHIPNTEILIVNDGSTDNTKAKINNMIKSKKAQHFARVIGYEKNQGKGNAVAYGMKAAKGDKVLFIDADGSINPDQIPLMLDKLDSYEVVVGDRLSKRSKVKTPPSRKFFSTGFNTLVSIMFQYSYRDNLCGFKGFRNYVAKKLFSDLKDKRWVFDVELFYKVKKQKYSIYFLPIEWHHVSGSRIKLLKDPILWFLRLVRLRIKLFGYH